VFAARGRCIGGRGYQRADLAYQREAQNISCHPQAAKHPHGAVIVMHRSATCRGTIEPWLNPTWYRPALALATVLKVVFFLDQRQQPQRQERKHRDRHRAAMRRKVSAWWPLR
jgi:hypothetical protein